MWCFGGPSWKDAVTCRQFLQEIYGFNSNPGVAVFVLTYCSSGFIFSSSVSLRFLADSGEVKFVVFVLCDEVVQSGFRVFRRVAYGSFSF